MGTPTKSAQDKHLEDVGVTAGRVFKQFEAGVEVVTDEASADGGAGNRTVRFTVTTNSVDRERDVIETVGIDTSAYERNPVVQFAHDYRSLPVGRTTKFERSETSLIATVEFASADLNPFADQVFKMIKAGFLSACSIGFRPLEWVYDETRGGVNFLKSEMLEFSICPVPANGEALIAAHAAGIDTALLKTWAERTLEAIAPESVAKTPPVDEPSDQIVLLDKSTLLDAVNGADLVDPFDRDEPSWKAFVKARDRAIEKAGEAGVKLNDIADLLSDFGFDAEADILKTPESFLVDATMQRAVVVDGPLTIGDLVLLTAKAFGEMTDEIRSKKMSKATESKLRVARDAVVLAASNLDDVLPVTASAESDESGGSDAAATTDGTTDAERAAASVVKADSGDDFIELDDAAPEELTFEIDGDLLGESVKEGLRALVIGETRSVLDAALGRITTD